MGKHQRKEEMDLRLDAWHSAVQAVKPVIELNPLAKLTTGNVLVTVAITSPADQHIDLIIRVADWLLETEES